MSGAVMVAEHAPASMMRGTFGRGRSSATEASLAPASDGLDELLPHRTGRGRSLGTRYAVESWFVAPSSYPDSHVPLVL